MNKEYSIIETTWGQLAIQENCNDCKKIYGYFNKTEKPILQDLCNILNSQNNQIDTLEKIEMDYWDSVQQNLQLENILTKIFKTINKTIKYYEQLAVDLRNIDEYGNKSAHDTIEVLYELKDKIKHIDEDTLLDTDKQVFQAITNLSQKYEAKYKEYQRQNNAEMMKFCAYYGLCLNELKTLLTGGK